jgi:iron(III) transport system substrate-binding protein
VQSKLVTWGPAIAAALILLSGCPPALAGDKLVVYHSWDDDAARPLLKAFQDETGIAVRAMRRSTRHLVKLIEAERDAPVASVVMAGSAPSYEMLKAAGLLEPYHPAGVEAIPIEFRDPDDHWFGFYLGVLAFASDRRRVPVPPTSFEDLLTLALPNGVCYSNPATSGTAYTFLISLIALKGEEPAFGYLERLHPRVVEVPSGGSMSVRLVDLGAADVAVAFAHDVLRLAKRNPDLVLSLPAEGTGWEVGAAALLKDAPSPQAGKLFLDFLARPDIQERIATDGAMPVFPTHPKAASPEAMPALPSIRRLALDAVEAGQHWDERCLRWNRQFPRGR